MSNTSNEWKCLGICVSLPEAWDELERGEDYYDRFIELWDAIRSATVTKPEDRDNLKPVWLRLSSWNDLMRELDDFCMWYHMPVLTRLDASVASSQKNNMFIWQGGDPEQGDATQRMLMCVIWELVKHLYAEGGLTAEQLSSTMESTLFLESTRQSVREFTIIEPSRSVPYTWRNGSTYKDDN